MLRAAFRREIRRTPHLLLADAANAAWILAVFVQTYRGRFEHLTNPWVVAPILVAILAHALRWQHLVEQICPGKERLLAHRLIVAARAFFAQCPYLLSPVPSLAFMQTLADREAASGRVPPLPTYGDLLCVLTRAPSFLAFHAGVLLLTLFALSGSVTPGSLRGAWFDGWPLVAALVVIVVGGGIYSGALALHCLGRRLFA